MKFSREPVTDQFIAEVLPLLKMHYEEIDHYKDIPLDPDFEVYKSLDKSGWLRNFVSRDEEGKIIGYCVYYVKNSMHYKTSIQAIHDVLFIDPSKRGFGKKFISWCDEQLKSEGVQVVYQHIKAAHNIGPMLERMGYELIDLVYGKRLDNGN